MEENRVLIADSSCDVREGAFFVPTVPLSLHFGDREYIDRDGVDIAAMLRDMEDMSQNPTSACPAPEAFEQAFGDAAEGFCVTLSSRLSGSYNSARIGMRDILEHHPERRLHVVDSRSASAAQILLTMQLAKMTQEGVPFAETVKRIEEFRDSMSTLFVIQHFENFIRSGRISKIAGVVAKLLSITPICGDDGEGQIKIFQKVRGERKALTAMVEQIARRQDPTGRTLVITHCNNPEGAQYVADLANEKYQIAETHIFPMGALSSYYAGNKGVILAI